MFWLKSKIKTIIIENFENLNLRVNNIWKNKNEILNNIVQINSILNKKYKEEGIMFFIDPSYEKGIAVSIPWLPNSIGAWLRIKQDNNILDKSRKETFFSDWIQYYYSFVSYDIQHKREYELLLEASNLYIEIFLK